MSAARAMRRRRDHATVGHRPYRPRAITYDVDVSLPTVASWNTGDWSQLRQSYGEPECPTNLRPVLAATSPRNSAFEDRGVFWVAHFFAGVTSDEMVASAADACWAMMDEKHGGHWRAGDVIVLAAPPSEQTVCPEGFECSEHRVCVSCGDTIHLGGFEASPGFGPVNPEAMTDLIVGNPPRCAECRGSGEVPT